MDKEAFENWWREEGSCPPLPDQDLEEHTKRMCEIAWSNGEFIATKKEDAKSEYD